MIKHLLILSGGSLILAFGFLLWIDYSLFWPIKTIEIQNYSDTNPIPILNEVVRPGESLQYELDYCKYTSVTGVIHRSFIDGQIITLQDSFGKLPTGCHKTILKTAVVPETINPGRYYLDVTADYPVNILRTVSIHYRTAYFVVVPKSASSTQATGAILPL